MKSKDTNKKNTFIIIIILIIIAIISIGTYALLTWTSTENTELTMRIGNIAGVYFETGPNINVSNIGPIFDYEADGENTYFTVTNYTNEEIEINANFNVTTISDNLKREDFKYVVMSSADQESYTKISEGNFSNATNNSTIALFNNHNLEANGIVTFKVIIFIDGNNQNPITMQGGSLTGVISVGAGEEAGTGGGNTDVITGPIVDVVIANLSDDIICDDSDDDGDANCNGVYKVENTLSDGTTVVTDYRYIGSEVNNYVSFNNDLYRIIGVFDEHTHGVDGEQLVKLIRNDSLGSYTWGTYNTNNTSGTYGGYKNDWTGTLGTTDTSDDTTPANLNVLLNEFFYNKTSTSNIYGECTDWTYRNIYVGNRYNKYDNCTNIVNYGINSSLQSYIQDVTWHLRGYDSSNYSKQNFYLCERGLSTDTTNCMGGNFGMYDVSTVEKIGLLYVSDFMYASGYYSYDDTTTGSGSELYNNNWLYGDYQWTITPSSSTLDVVYAAHGYGYVSTTIITSGGDFKPTFYLKSSVNITDGIGTSEQPYIITCDTCTE